MEEPASLRERTRSADTHPPFQWKGLQKQDAGGGCGAAATRTPAVDAERPREMPLREHSRASEDSKRSAQGVNRCKEHGRQEQNWREHKAHHACWKKLRVNCWKSQNKIGQQNLAKRQAGATNYKQIQRSLLVEIKASYVFGLMTGLFGFKRVPFCRFNGTGLDRTEWVQNGTEIRVFWSLLVCFLPSQSSAGSLQKPSSFCLWSLVSNELLIIAEKNYKNSAKTCAVL